MPAHRSTALNRNELGDLPGLNLPQEVDRRSLPSPRAKLINNGAKVVCYGRYITFQLAEVAISRALFAEILRLIKRLRPAPLPPWRRLIQ